MRRKTWLGTVTCVLAFASCTSVPSPEVQKSTTVWDPASWRPAVTVPLQSMDPDEMARQRLMQLSDIAKAYKIKPTRTPALERWTLPDEQAIPVSVCLQEAGWSAKAAPNGGLETEAEPAQRTALGLAVYDCSARYSIDPRYLSQPTPQMYANVWSYFKDYGIPCLAHFGVQPDEPLPTQQTFVATNGRWLLYPQNATLPDDVQRSCPQLPPTRAMFGL